MHANELRAPRSERIRCAIARTVFRTTLAATEASTAAAPKGHPWRVLTQSALEDISTLTPTALRARATDGAPAVEVRKRPPWKLAIATYLVACQFLPLLPGVVLFPNGPKLYPMHSIGLVDEPLVAPRLRVYITDTKSRLEPIEQSLSASA